MACLLCQRVLPQSLRFYELFSLHQPRQTLCARCRAGFELIGKDHCPRCHRADSDQVCPDCQRWEDAQGVIVSHRAIFRYNDAMKDFFKRYKFAGDYRLRAVFAPYFKQSTGYTLLPIPVSPERFQIRGFNQVTGFLDAARLPYADILTKSDTLKQSSLTRAERLETKNAFSLKENATIPQKICLVDDIYTTGATLQHAAQTLREAGATDVISFSLCR